jgi:hypothetical protein
MVNATITPHSPAIVVFEVQASNRAFSGKWPDGKGWEPFVALPDAELCYLRKQAVNQDEMTSF